jgi:uncharacterized membrane protein
MFRRSLLVAALILGTLGVAFQTTGRVVRAILFFSPTCPHCHVVITESLPPIMDHYQEQLQIVAVDVTTAGGQRLYQAAIEALAIPEGRRGVPTMVIGTAVLVGSYEIPAELPGLVDAGLAQGGLDWPDIPGLREALPEEQAAAIAAPSAQAPHSLWASFAKDITGNTLALLVLIATLGSLGWAAIQLGLKGPSAPQSDVRPAWQQRGLPLIALAGVGISLYLAYVESTGSLAVCGPIGDCNAVQQSEYARLFGVLPVAALGVVGYGLMASIHIYRRNRIGRAAGRAGMVLLALAFFGTLFSAYLTFLEAFVIGAVCAWCLTSAVLMIALLVLTVGETRGALARGPQRLSA